MKSNWILVADSCRARIFTAETLSSPLKEMDGLIHSEGRLMDRELTTDLPGKNRGEDGKSGHAFEQPTDPKQHEVDSFARLVVQHLEDADNANKINRLLLIAEPKFLGLLREHLPKHLKDRVSFELDKNITQLDIDDIRNYVPTHLP